MFIRMQLSLPREARYVGMLRKLSRIILSDLRAAEEPLSEFELALGEACANAVRHAAGTADYQVNLSFADDHCEIEVVDLGPGFDPPPAPDPGGDGRLPESESGRGLLLMRALTDDFELQRGEGGMRVRLVKRFPGLGLR